MSARGRDFIKIVGHDKWYCGRSQQNSRSTKRVRGIETLSTKSTRNINGRDRSDDMEKD